MMHSGLIEPMDDMVDFGRKSVSSFAPGPRFAEYFDHKTGTENLEIHAGGWVSDYGIVGLELAACPVCGTEISIQNAEELEILKMELVKASHRFLKTGSDAVASMSHLYRGKFNQILANGTSSRILSTGFRVLELASCAGMPLRPGTLSGRNLET